MAMATLIHAAMRKKTPFNLSIFLCRDTVVLASIALPIVLKKCRVEPGDCVNRGLSLIIFTLYP